MLISDLLYGCDQYKEDLISLLPTAKITDGSDDVHTDRVAVEVEMEEDEYLRLIILDGFIQASLFCQLKVQQPEGRTEIDKLIDQWKIDYPEKFKNGF